MRRGAAGAVPAVGGVGCAGAEAGGFLAVHIHCRRGGEGNSSWSEPATGRQERWSAPLAAGRTAWPPSKGRRAAKPCVGYSGPWSKNCSGPATVSTRAATEKCWNPQQLRQSQASLTDDGVGAPAAQPTSAPQARPGCYLLDVKQASLGSLMMASALQSQAKVWKSPRNGAMSALVTSAFELAGPAGGGEAVCRAGKTRVSGRSGGPQGAGWRWLSPPSSWRAL